jgi:hypothetical protein
MEVKRMCQDWLLKKKKKKEKGKEGGKERGKKEGRKGEKEGFHLISFRVIIGVMRT